MKEFPTIQLVVAAALQRDNGDWLMHQRPLEKHHGGLWEFPGGKVDPGETPANALIRELSEELGIAVLERFLVPTGFATGDGPGCDQMIVILLYTVREWTGEPRALEGEAVGWFSEANCIALDKPPLDAELVAGLFGDGGA